MKARIERAYAAACQVVDWRYLSVRDGELYCYKNGTRWLAFRRGKVVGHLCDESGSPWRWYSTPLGSEKDAVEFLTSKNAASKFALTEWRP